MIIPLAEPLITQKDIKEITAQVKSTFIGPGKATDEFSKLICKTTGRKYAIPISSGTVALSIAAKAIGLTYGDEVLIPSYGVISVINAFASIGVIPRLVDIKKNNGCMDPSKIISKITNKTKAICYINFLGNIGDEINEVKKICKQNNLFLIEDAAWSLGREYNDTKGAAIGDISITSFSVPKIISTGQGGAILTDSGRIKNQVIKYIDQGDLNWRKTNNISSIGSNLRMSDINAALGISQIKMLKKRMDLKRLLTLFL